METAYDSLVSVSPFPSDVAYTSVPVVSPEARAEQNQRNIEALLGVLEDDLLDKGNFFNELRKYAYRKTRNLQLAEDAVADFYCNTVRKVRDGVLKFEFQVDREKGVKGNPKIRPLAFNILRNSIIDSYRRRHSGINRKLFSFSDIYEGIRLIKNETPQETALKRESENIIRWGMQQLSEHHREVIQLHYFDGLEYNQTAEILGIPLNTVKSRLRYALKQLRRDLSHYNSSQ